MAVASTFGILADQDYTTPIQPLIDSTEMNSFELHPLGILALFEIRMLISQSVSIKRYYGDMEIDP